jgi:hypothetical protein
MSANDFELVSAIVRSLRAGGMDVWVFGGWAEELQRMRPPGPHTDVDLLLRAADFGPLDAFMPRVPRVTEIPQKRFSHKRAFVWQGVRVEVFLVQPAPHELTVLFDGRAMVQWPAGTFASGFVEGLPVASKSALKMYRRDHDQVVRAYAEFTESRARTG